MLVVYQFVYHNQPGADTLAFDADMHRAPVEELIHNVRRVASWWMIRANTVLQIGGVGEDVEADEVSFRTLRVIQDSEEKAMWVRFLGVVRRGSALCYWGELEVRTTKARKGGGGPLGVEEFEHHMLHRGMEAGHEARPLISRGSVVHTDTAKTYAQLHRLTGTAQYKRLGLWVTHVRHSSKKGADGRMMPVQFVVRKKVQLLSGQWVRRKGGTQKKDGFWASIRKHVSRRATPSCHSKVLRQMAFFFQWMWWRSDDPVGDAMRGRHTTLPTNDMLRALGALRQNLRTFVGEEALTEHGAGWFDALVEKALEDLPAPRKRVWHKSPES